MKDWIFGIVCILIIGGCLYSSNHNAIKARKEVIELKWELVHLKLKVRQLEKDIEMNQNFTLTLREMFYEFRRLERPLVYFSAPHARPDIYMVHDEVSKKGG